MSQEPVQPACLVCGGDGVRTYGYWSDGEPITARCYACTVPEHQEAVRAEDRFHCDADKARSKAAAA
jgi:hypothetical protein